MTIRKAILFYVLFLLIFAGFSYARAQEGEYQFSSKNLAAVFIAQDETVEPESLGVGIPKVLPGNPFYFIKNFGRGIQSTLTFSKDKKAELKLRFANEKIVEVQILANRGDNKRAVEHLKSYEKDLASAKGLTDVGKFITQSFKHQAILDRIEKEAPSEAIAAIKEVRDKTIEHIAVVVAGAQDSESVSNALISSTGEEGSPFKPLRNLEVLKALEEKVPEQARHAIQLAQENSVKRFKSEYEKISEEEKEALADYIRGSGGSGARYMEVFNERKDILGEELTGKLLNVGEEKVIEEAILEEVKAEPEKSPTLPVPTLIPVFAPAPKVSPQPTPTQSIAPTKTAPEPIEKLAPTPTPTIEKATDIKPYDGSPPLMY